MKTIYLILVVSIFGIQLVSAQFENPVTIKYAAEHIFGQRWKVSITAVIENGWYIYSQHMEEGGPIPTKIVFAKHKQATFKNEPKELGELLTKFEDVFAMETKYYKEKVTFEQEVVVKGDLPIEVAGEIEYMTCNGEVCMPPKKELFRVVLK